MKITKTELKKIIKEELLKEFGSEEYGRQTKEFEPIPGVDFDNPKEAQLRQICPCHPPPLPVRETGQSGRA